MITTNVVECDFHLQAKNSHPNVMLRMCSTLMEKDDLDEEAEVN